MITKFYIQYFIIQDPYDLDFLMDRLKGTQK